MTSAREIYAGTPGADQPEANRAAHRDLLSRLNAEAARVGWAGSAIEFYRREDGYISISIVPGDRPATLDDVRAFRERQRAEVAAAPPEPEQKGLFQ